MQTLKGRTAVLTGASHGIGVYIARELANEGMNLALGTLSVTKLETIAAKVQAKDTKAIVIPTDMADVSALQALVATTTQEFGTIDVLINNAGIEMFFAYHKLMAQDIDRIIRVNLIGAMLLTRLVLPQMLTRRSGHIINISSLSGKAGPPCSEPYAASKAGLIAFTESLRSEYRGTGVSASVICPGFVEAGIYERLKAETGMVAPWVLGTSSPELVARAVVRAIKKDIPEIIINPGPTRLLTTLAELSPSFAEWAMQIFGISYWFRKVADIRESNISRHN